MFYIAYLVCISSYSMAKSISQRSLNPINQSLVAKLPSFTTSDTCTGTAVELFYDSETLGSCKLFQGGRSGWFDASYQGQTCKERIDWWQGQAWHQCLRGSSGPFDNSEAPYPASMLVADGANKYKITSMTEEWAEQGCWFRFDPSLGACEWYDNRYEGKWFHANPKNGMSCEERVEWWQGQAWHRCRNGIDGPLSNSLAPYPASIIVRDGETNKYLITSMTEEWAQQGCWFRFDSSLGACEWYDNRYQGKWFHANPENGMSCEERIEWWQGQAWHQCLNGIDGPLSNSVAPYPASIIVRDGETNKYLITSMTEEWAEQRCWYRFDTSLGDCDWYDSRWSGKWFHIGLNEGETCDERVEWLRAVAWGQCAWGQDADFPGTMVLNDADHYTITIATPAPTQAPTQAPTHYVVRGRITAGCEEVDGDCNTQLADDDQIHAIRCCSDVAVANFIKKSDVCWGSSYFGQGTQNQETPYPSRGSPIQEGCMWGTWSQAFDKCAAEGGRLCTEAEIDGGCTAYTGCWFDAQLVWTSDTGNTEPLEEDHVA